MPSPPRSSTQRRWSMRPLISPLAACVAVLALLAGCASSQQAAKDVRPTVAPVTDPPARNTALTVGRGSPKPTPYAAEPEKRTVYFAFGEAAIDEDGGEVLRQNAQKLKEDSQLVVTLVGHTDNLGSPAYNLAVADKRVEAVSERLRSLGVARTQIRRLPVGSEHSSKIRCDGETCRRAMRRVELVYERR
ncbi:MAG TPA: OmpA family protein [Accumulibacter sp.]|uniref:OmpA family protein n=2 Tax=Accumulibacter sp. TaxID=2053492 RepID=UPI002879CC89|nr:OmpA family protein [Accumulibacter sp.]MDS4056302.1 OmpA family protein [Accumulibacter sp.]HMV06682.1 OmpA family protein [Accumulibacter sp.]HMW78857.1 OmpA family protein [Accumulibacter sp.]HMX67904.1 OmpA family protein [Accumulibacter sp.]HNC26284.1 OmpA family protein [Accumulibacter sp.]